MAGPAARVTALTSTTFTVTVDSVTALASSTLKLQTRALGAATDWTTQATDATPAIGDTLQATGLTAGTPLEWRVTQEAGTTIDDGTHGIVTPASSIWATLISTVETTLEGAGITTVYEGESLPPNATPIAALSRTLPEVIRRDANNLVEVEYPVELWLFLVETSDTGEHRTQDVATHQRTIISSFDKKTIADFPSITGLVQVTVEIRSKDEAGRGDFSDMTTARAVIRFLIWESR